MLQVDIVEQCKANDQRTRLKRYQHYRQGMFSIAVRFVKNADDAWGIVQESCITAFPKIDRKRRGALSGRVKKMVVPTRIDLLKSSKMHKLRTRFKTGIPLLKYTL